MKKRLLAVCVVPAFLLTVNSGAQTLVDSSQLKALDLSRKPTILFRGADTLPPTCSPGEALLKTDAPAGSNFYVCLTTNTWELQGSTLGFTPLDRTGNLSDLSDPAAARTNLGLGAAAVKAVHGTGGSLAAFAGGLTIPNDCVVFDAAGNLADAGAPCGGGGASGPGAPNYAQAFTGQTSVTLTHNANTTSVLIQCFDGANNLLIPNSVTLTNANTATVAFAAAQTGTCIVNSSGGGGAGGGASSFGQLTGVASIAQGGTGRSSAADALNALSPATAKGDTIVFDGAAHRRVGVGADGSCWIADSTQAAGVRWGSCTGLTPGAGIALAGSALSIDVTTVPTFLTGAANVVFPSIAQGACAVRTFGLTGVSTADAVAGGWPSTLESGLIGMMRVSADNLIEVRLCNFSGTAVTPNGGHTFRATIVRSF